MEKITDVILARAFVSGKAMQIILPIRLPLSVHLFLNGTGKGF